MSFLADTNVLSELARPAPNAGVVEWASRLTRISLSAITVEEVCFGLSLKPNPKVLSWFEAFFESHCDVLAVTDAIARRAGHLRGQLQAVGRTRSQADMLIAATAAVEGLTVATRNTADFDGCGVRVLNPFS